MSDQPIDITLRPDPAGNPWVRLAEEHFTSGLAGGALSAAARAALGLATDAPVVMTGHQAEWWHAGILAKAIAADQVAIDAAGHAAWIIVDQDDHDASSLRLPVSGPDREVRALDWVLTSGETGADRSGASADGGDGVPTGRTPLLSLPSPPQLGPGERYAADSVLIGVERVTEAIRGAGARAQADAHAAPGPPASRAVQCALALAALASPSLRRSPRLVMATALGRVHAFHSLVRRMVDDPDTCAREYNAAVEAFPHAGVSPLKEHELPLWRIGAELGSPRHRVDVAQARRLLEEQPEVLVPRALLMTGFLRLHACDLFIHGLGGEKYDPITERWFDRWLGARLAPTTTVSATLLLEMHNAPAARIVTPAEVARAKWTRHHARHDPGTLHDVLAAEQKAGLLRQLAALRRARRRRDTAGAEARAESARLYRELHTLLGRWRTAQGSALARLEMETAELEAQARRTALRNDRTWFFALHPEARLAELERGIRARLSTGRA